MHPQKWKKLACELCEFKTIRKCYLNEHVNGVHLKLRPYKCPKCDFTTAYSSDLSVHTKKIHVKCNKCPFITYSNTLLQRHCRIHDRAQRSAISLVVEPRDSLSTNNSERPTGPKKMSALNEEDSKAGTDSDSQVPATSPGTKTLTTQPRISACDICGFVARGWMILVDHVNGVHLKIKPYKCDQCEYSSAYYTMMFKHKKNPHFDCAHCKFVTHSSKLLKEHTKIHNTFRGEGKTPNVSVESKENMNKKIDIKPMEECAQGSKNKSDKFHRENETEKVDPRKVDYESNDENNVSLVGDNMGNLPDIPHSHNSVGEENAGSKNVSAIDEIKSETVKNEDNDDTIDEFWTYEEIAFACKSCDFTGDSGRSLTKHIAEVHNKSSPKGTINPDEKLKNDNFVPCKTETLTSQGVKKSLFKCRDCTFVSESAKELVHHTQSVHNWVPALPKPMRKCSKCDFICETYRMLWKHNKIAHIKTSNAEHVKCSECNFFCTKKRILSRHVTRAHPELEPEGMVTCLECNYNCYSTPGLKRHVTAAHRKTRVKYEKVNCSDCNLVCNGMRLLSRHALDVHQKVLNFNKNPRVAQQQRKTKLVKDKLCHFCPYSTAYEFNLKKHINAKHMKDKLYNCHLCDFSSSYPNTLKQHKEIVHCQNNNFNCSLCLYNFQTKEVLNRHWKLVHGRVQIDLKCQYCEFESGEVISLDLHIREAHNDTAYRRTCNQCLFSTYNEATLQAHRETIHERKYIKLSKCHLCTSTLNGKHNKKIHWKQVHGNIQVDLKCQKCNFEAMGLEGMEVHYRESHTENAKLKTCAQCQFSSYHEPTIYAHNESVHENNLSVYEENAEAAGCQLCSFVGVSAQYLKQHMTMKHDMKNHPETDLYRCNLCLGTFTQRGNIKRHTERIHGNINVDLKCRECSYEGKELELIEVHYKESHPETAQLNVCGQCHFSSYHDPTLRAHTSIHDGKKCELCSYVGSTKYHLKRHIDIRHVRIRNHICEICGYATFLKPHLETHMKNHIQGMHRYRKSGSANQNQDTSSVSKEPQKVSLL